MLQADSRYAALNEAYNKREDAVKEEIDPLVESKGLLDLEPVGKEINEIKEYQVRRNAPRKITRGSVPRNLSCVCGSPKKLPHRRLPRKLRRS